MTLTSADFDELLKWVRTPDIPWKHTVMATFLRRKDAQGSVDQDFLVYGGILDFRESSLNIKGGTFPAVFSGELPEILAPGADLTFAPKAKLTITLGLPHPSLEIWFVGGPNDGLTWHIPQPQKFPLSDPGTLDITFGNGADGSEYFISLFMYRQFNRLLAGVVSDSTTMTKHLYL